MKKVLKNAIYLCIFAGLLYGCLDLVSSSHPESAPVNSKFDVQFVGKVDIDKDLGDTRHTVLVGILAPKAWDVANTAVITYSSADMTDGAVTDAPMRLATATDVSPEGLVWPAQFTKLFGTQGNYEPVEWVAFISEKYHNWDPGDSFTVTVNIKMQTGADNIKTNLMYYLGNTQDGANSDPQYFLSYKQPNFITTGGEGALIDYTLPKMASVTPKYFTYEDIICVNYDPTIETDGVASPLLNEEEIYLMATATYGGEVTASNEEISTLTKMTKNGNVFFKYLYPHHYLGIPAGKKIESFRFWFVNADGSIVVNMPSGDPFTSDEREN